MDRRSTLDVLFRGRTRTQKQVRRTTVSSGSGLEPYTGTWDEITAGHLLRRTTFGPTKDELKQSVQYGLAWTMGKLFENRPLPTPPINYYYDKDPNVPIGSTWINAPYQADINVKYPRIQSLYAWSVGVMITSGMHIREKMTLFWHNHFVTARSELNDPKFQYDYISRLRRNALGNFRDFVKKMTIDPSMLRYLNGNQNTAAKPNENYAREILELFALGKGPIAGPGDYTNYTEDDVIALARVFTGWRDRGFNTLNPDIPVESYYTSGRHDKGDKQLSHRFNNAVITNGEDQEYAQAIDIIFQKEECARFICRKLYRWYVYYEIDETVEATVIAPMAQILIDNDYNIQPALYALLNSAHFYDDCLRGAMIKNPVDFSMTMVRQSGWFPGDDIYQKYRYWRLLFNQFGLMQMAYYDPPSVAGWKAWYQEPGFYQIWLNSVTLPTRAELSRLMAVTGIKVSGKAAPLPVIEWVAKFDDPYDPNALIEEFAFQLFPRGVSQTKLDYLKGVLLPGLPDYEWTVEYGDFVADPSNEALAKAVENKLRTLLSTMLQMPEYQLS